MQDKATRIPPCCGHQDGISRGLICVKPCNQISTYWEEGNERFYCEPFEKALKAFDTTVEVWPWVRPLKCTARNSHSTLADGKFSENGLFIHQLAKWFRQLY